MRLVQWTGPVTKPPRHHPGAAKAVQIMLHMVSQKKYNQTWKRECLGMAPVGIASRHHFKEICWLDTFSLGVGLRYSLPMSPLPCRCDKPGQGCSFPALIPPP